MIEALNWIWFGGFVITVLGFFAVYEESVVQNCERHKIPVVVGEAILVLWAVIWPVALWLWYRARRTSGNELG